jgi:hypothetical protein
MVTAAELLKIIDECTWLVVALIVIVLSLIQNTHRKTRCAMIVNSLQVDVVRLIALSLPGSYALWAITAVAAQIILLLGCVVVLRKRIWVYVLQATVLGSYVAGAVIVSVKQLITVEQGFMGMLAGFALGACGVRLTMYCVKVLRKLENSCGTSADRSNGVLYK